MADTVKQKIIDNLKTTIDAIPEIEGSTEINAPDIIDLETAALPKVFIDSNIEDEDEEEGELGKEAWMWRPIISVYYRVKDTKDNREPEKMLGALHKALTTDRHRGGWANETRRLTADVLEIEAEDGLVQAVVTMWEIRYTHEKDDPFTL